MKQLILRRLGRSKSDCGHHHGVLQCAVGAFFPRQARGSEALVHFAGDGDASLAKKVCDLGFAEPRGIVFERQMVLLFIDAKAAQAIGIRELTEAAELFEAQGRLQFVSDVKERHGGKYTGKKLARKEAKGSWRRG